MAANVHCRTGSLEIYTTGNNRSRYVHCRTGSIKLSKPMPIISPQAAFNIKAFKNNYLTTHILYPLKNIIHFFKDLG